MIVHVQSFFPLNYTLQKMAFYSSLNKLCEVLLDNGIYVPNLTVLVFTVLKKMFDFFFFWLQWQPQFCLELNSLDKIFKFHERDTPILSNCIIKYDTMVMIRIVLKVVDNGTPGYYNTSSFMHFMPKN